MKSCETGAKSPRRVQGQKEELLALGERGVEVRSKSVHVLGAHPTRDKSLLGGLDEVLQRRREGRCQTGCDGYGWLRR